VDYERHRRKRRPRWIKARIEGSREFLAKSVWSKDLGSLPTFRALGYKMSRVAFLAWRGILENRCLFRAQALTYITVLSLVPLLAFGLSVAKGFNADETLRSEVINPFVEQFLGEEGAVAEGVTEPGAEAAVSSNADIREGLDTALEFVSETNFTSLGAFGLILLLYSIIKMLSSVEQSFNEIWGVKKARGWTRKFADYLSMVVIVPLFLVTATGITAAAQEPGFVNKVGEWLPVGREYIEPVTKFLLGILPIFGKWLGFSFVYMFMPNTRTRVSSALLGGVIGGTLWHVSQVLMFKFGVGISNFNAIYAGFALFPILLFWIYVSCATVLIVAELAFAHQNEPAYRQIARSRAHDHAFHEVLAMRAIVRVGVAFLKGEEAPRITDLADSLAVPERSIEEVFAKLRDHRILAVSEEGSVPAFLPGRDLDRITVKNVLDALKGKSGKIAFAPSGPLDSEIDAVLGAYEEEKELSSNNKTLRQLAEECISEGDQEPPIGLAGVGEAAG